MRRIGWWLGPAMVGLVLMGCGGFGVNPSSPVISRRPSGVLKPGIQVGRLARDIRGTDLDGKEFALSDYRGKVVLLDFWATW